MNSELKLLFDEYSSFNFVSKKGKFRFYYVISLLINDYSNLNDFTLKSVVNNNYFTKTNFKVHILEFYNFVTKKIKGNRNAEVSNLDFLLNNKVLKSKVNLKRFIEFVNNDCFDKRHVLDLSYFYKNYFPLYIRNSLLDIEIYDIYSAFVRSLKSYKKQHDSAILNVANLLKDVRKNRLTFKKIKSIFYNKSKYEAVLGINFLLKLPTFFDKDELILKKKQELNKFDKIPNTINAKFLSSFYDDESLEQTKINNIFIERIYYLYLSKYKKIKNEASFKKVIFYIDNLCTKNDLSIFNDSSYITCIKKFKNQSIERYYITEIFLLAQEIMNKEDYKSQFQIYKYNILLNTNKDVGYYLYFMDYENSIPSSDKIKFIDTNMNDTYPSNITYNNVKINFEKIENKNFRVLIKKYFCGKKWVLSSMKTSFKHLCSFTKFLNSEGENELSLKNVEKFIITFEGKNVNYINKIIYSLINFFNFLKFAGINIDKNLLNLDTLSRYKKTYSKSMLITQENLQKLLIFLKKSNNNIDKICLQILYILPYFQPRLSEILTLRIDNVYVSSEKGCCFLSMPNKLSPYGDILGLSMIDKNFPKLINLFYLTNRSENNCNDENYNKFVFVFKNKSGHMVIPKPETINKHYKKWLLSAGTRPELANYNALRKFFITLLDGDKTISDKEKRLRARHTYKSKIHQAVYINLTDDEIKYFAKPVGNIDYAGKEFIDSSKYRNELPFVSKCLFCKHFYYDEGIKDYIDMKIKEFEDFDALNKDDFSKFYIDTVLKELIKMKEKLY